MKRHLALAILVAASSPAQASPAQADIDLFQCGGGGFDLSGRPAELMPFYFKLDRAKNSVVWAKGPAYHVDTIKIDPGIIYFNAYTAGAKDVYFYMVSVLRKNGETMIKMKIAGRINYEGRFIGGCLAVPPGGKPPWDR